MSVYEKLGVTPVINAAATLTRLGGSRMAPEVLDAMNDAAASFVHIDELQAKAGDVIARITGAEAGYVTTGAAAALTLGTAACLAGMDVSKMDRLPDTTGMRNEVVVQKGHRNAYDHAVRAAGVTFVEVGTLGYPGAGGTFGWQIEEAITEKTCAVFCPILATPGTLSLRDVAEIAHAKGVPVIVDAAAELPPRSNLQRFIAEGADLVAFSGGKSIGGPQSSGVLAGRRDLIDSVALQHQDMDVRTETWSKRHYIDEGRVRGVPTQGFGRALKVGREEIVGLITALEIFTAGRDEDDWARWDAVLDIVHESLDDIPGTTVHRTSAPPARYPAIWLEIDDRRTGIGSYELLDALLKGDPPIAAAESLADRNQVGVLPHGLTQGEAAVVGRRIRESLTQNS